MQTVNIIREVDIIQTARVMQVESIFDIPIKDKSHHEWKINLPLDEKKWNVGLIVGPSGSGKTTIVNELFENELVKEFSWSKEHAVIDAFPKAMGIKEIINLLSSVGFSSPPDWLKPFGVLSNGQKFRINAARALAEMKDMCVIDEFSSVVDRTVAKIGSSSIAKTTRRLNKKIILASCHYDIEKWLQPDWIYKVHDKSFHWRFLQQRPEINLRIVKVHRRAWEIFGKHHYLSGGIHKASQCFVAFWKNIPVAFHCYLHFPNNYNGKVKRGHRVVCLPDYQGVSIGTQLENFTASCLKAVGFEYIIQTAHPARMQYCAKSPLWKLIKQPKISTARRSKNGQRAKKGSVCFRNRLITSFRYVGGRANQKLAKDIGYG